MEENNQVEVVEIPCIEEDNSNSSTNSPVASTSTPQSVSQDEYSLGSSPTDSEKSDMSTHHTDETDEKSLSRQGSNVSLSSNTLCKGVYDNFRGSHPLYEDTVLTIEGLHLYLNSCFTCGVYWKADHVTIGCNECGGYGLKRPCPECDGQCQVMWKRNLTMSHSNHRAKWSGECGFKSKDSLEENLTPALEKLTTTP